MAAALASIWSTGAQGGTWWHPLLPGGGEDCAEFTSERSRYVRMNDWSDEEDEFDDDEGTGRSFFFKELVLSGFYSHDGFVGLPMGDADVKHLEFSPRPPGTYVAVEYVRTFSSSSFVNRRVLPEWLPLATLDLHPRVLYDPMQPIYSSDPVKFAPQDFWVRFNPGGRDRLMLQAGQFVIPYGVNPVLAPRQRFIVPVEAVDLGLKWDWGLGLKGPAGEYDWLLATTIGSGEALHSPHLFENSSRTSYLITGRFGTPTYWDIQYGISGLYGELPMTRGANRMGDFSISRWRLGLDTFWRAGIFLMAGAQLTYGQDGFEEEGMTASDVLGYQVYADWVLPWLLDLRLSGQFASVNRDLTATDVSDTSLILESQYSFTNSISTMLNYRVELERSMGKKANAFFITFIYYG